MVVSIIETRNLTVYYGRHRGIIDVNLSVEQGEVFGFLGPNGAGKTTTMRVLMDIIRPTSGQALLFGFDSQKYGPAVRSRVGYVPGELSLYTYMSGRSFLDMLTELRGNNVDVAYRRQLCERLDLDPSRKIGEYSQGNKRKIGLIAALMFRPDLLILDEPTNGLDPLVQRTVHDLVREARQEGRTVFVSSHNLPEVQAICDRVGLIRSGRMIAVERVDTLVARHVTRLSVTLDSAPSGDTFALDGVRVQSQDGRRVSLEVRDNLQAVLERAVSHGVASLETHPVTLEEAFMAYYGANGDTNGPISA